MTTGCGLNPKAVNIRLWKLSLTLSQYLFPQNRKRKVVINEQRIECFFSQRYDYVDIEHWPGITNKLQ
jgi:hypothetical protein